MQQRAVLAIDAGYRNFAICFMDEAHGADKPLLHYRENLWRGAKPPTPVDIIRITRQWCMDNELLLRTATHIVLEKQLRELFQTMNAVIHTLYFDKVEQVDARSIGKYWGLPRKRADKKRAAVELVRARDVPLVGDKVDDLADAWLMAAWKLLKI